MYAELDATARDRLHAEGAGGDQLAALMLSAIACTPQPVGWRLYSRRLRRDLWVIRDADALAELPAAGLPVIHGDDLERLRGLNDAALRRVLDVLATCPGTRVVGLPPEDGRG